MTWLKHQGADNVADLNQLPPGSYTCKDLADGLSMPMLKAQRLLSALEGTKSSPIHRREHRFRDSPLHDRCSEAALAPACCASETSPHSSVFRASGVSTQSTPCSPSPRSQKRARATVRSIARLCTRCHVPAQSTRTCGPVPCLSESPARPGSGCIGDCAADPNGSRTHSCADASARLP
jgi:hypothetical protein